jgi:hypothetical protein
MKLGRAEIEFLSAWAREEWEPQCYRLPAHRLQLAHGVTGGLLIDFIKAWPKAEGKKDQDILRAAAWSRTDEFTSRLEEARKDIAARPAAV